MEGFFDPAVLLSLATAIYASAFWLWFVSRNAPRAILTLASGCALAHLTLMRYHSLLNSPSLHLLLALFWLVPLVLFGLRHENDSPGSSGRADDRFGDADHRAGGPGETIAVVLILSYAVLFTAIYFSAIASDLIFVLLFQPGLMLCALYLLIASRRDSALIFTALACFWALLWFLAYAPLAPAPDASGGEGYGNPLQMWPRERAYLALFWTASALPILRDALDRPRIMVWGAVVLFAALIQNRMGALPVFLTATAVGTALIGAATWLRGDQQDRR